MNAISISYSWWNMNKNEWKCRLIAYKKRWLWVFEETQGWKFKVQSLGSNDRHRLTRGWIYRCCIVGFVLPLASQIKPEPNAVWQIKELIPDVISVSIDEYSEVIEMQITFLWIANEQTRRHLFLNSRLILYLNLLLLTYFWSIKLFQ